MMKRSQALDLILVHCEALFITSSRFEIHKLNLGEDEMRLRDISVMHKSLARLFRSCGFQSGDRRLGRGRSRSPCGRLMLLSYITHPTGHSFCEKEGGRREGPCWIKSREGQVSTLGPPRLRSPEMTKINEVE